MSNSFDNLPKVMTNQIYHHFKGNDYLVKEIATSTIDGSSQVVYQALYDDCKVYVRSLEEFTEKCNPTQYATYGQEYRFELKKVNSKVEVKNHGN